MQACALCVGLAAVVWPLPSDAQAVEDGLFKLATAKMHEQMLEQAKAPAQLHGSNDVAKGLSGASALRFEVEVGRLDERLRLAPCERIEPQWPAGVRAWGTVRVALRCAKGPTPWKVYLPVKVRAMGMAIVSTKALPSGATVEAHHLARAEVDYAASRDEPLSTVDALLGRTLVRAVPAGQPISASDLRARQWFSVGDTVRIDAVGPGYRVASEGEAVTPGIEGQTSRVRTASGRVVTGRAVGERHIEVSL